MDSLSWASGLIAFAALNEEWVSESTLAKQAAPFLRHRAPPGRVAQEPHF